MRFRIPTYAMTLAMLASPALAAEKKGSSMPQMNPEWYANQLFWLAVSFVLLYLLVSCVIMPRLNRVIGGRKTTIEEMIAEAEAMKNQAKDARKHYEDVEANARKEASNMVAEVTATMNRSISESQTAMDADVKKRIAASDAAIAAKLQSANEGVAAAAASLASEMYHSLLGEKIEAKRFEQAIAKRA